MTEPVDVLILNALLTKLTTPALDSPATPIAHPRVAYAPTPGTAYFHVHPVMRAETETPWLAFDSDALHRGIFQVDAVVPDNAGEAAGLRLASLVVTRFARGTLLAVGSDSLKVLVKPTIGAVVMDKPWLRYPVTIPYFIAVAS